MVKKAKVVIGANFGDEGKGLMADYFCHEAISNGETCIGVLYNGGSQRGHTVVTPEGIRHVFHHFSSGTFAGADTYMAKGFILNPIVFCQEYEELKRLGYAPRQVFVHPHCQITTPYDMLINQHKERIRKDAKHGSCGMGIYETQLRSAALKGFEYGWCHSHTNKERVEMVKKIRSYYENTSFNEFDVEEKELFLNDGLLEHYIRDLHFMIDHMSPVQTCMLSIYDTLVLEGGQGLMLDKNNIEYFPHLTPSSTGSLIPKDILNEFESPYDVEFCYVTRPYLTRHGAGRLDNECCREELNGFIAEDKTNIWNPHQENIRYAPIVLNELWDRVSKDFNKDNIPNYQCSLAITHRNETTELFITHNHSQISIPSFVSTIYESCNETREIEAYPRM